MCLQMKTSPQMFIDCCSSSLGVLLKHNSSIGHFRLHMFMHSCWYTIQAGTLACACSTIPVLCAHTHTHTQSYVSLLNSDDQSDIAQKIISEGLARVDKRRDRRLTKLVREKWLLFIISMFIFFHHSKATSKYTLRTNTVLLGALVGGRRYGYVWAGLSLQLILDVVSKSSAMVIIHL